MKAETITPEQFKAIRESLGLSQQSLADRLEISKRQVVRYEQAQWPVPRTIEYALMWLAHEQARA